MGISSMLSVVAAWPLDWMIVAALVLVFAVDAVRAGTRHLTAIAIAAPIAVLALSYLTSAAYIGPIVGQIAAPYSGVVVFGALFILLFVFMNRMLGLWSADSNGPLSALIAAIACAAVVLVVWLQVPALDAAWHFGPQIQAIFGTSYRFWMLVVAYAALAYVRS